jgi:tetratricopeptide (TPR) repeat protein
VNSDGGNREAGSDEGELLQPGSAQRLEDRREHVLRDLDELSDQVAAGEMDTETADRLRAAYEAELGAMERGPQHDEPDDLPQGRSSRRTLAGAILLIGAFTVVIILAAQALRSGDEPSPQADESDVAATEGATLEQMEELVAANPDVPGMRLALADLYFAEGDYMSAIDHYLVLASAELPPEEESRTLGRIGWMAHATGQTDAAVQYITAALDIDPDYVEGKLFLGLVRLYGLEDVEGAIPLLEEVLAFPELQPGIRAEVEVALEEARAATESP